MTREIDIEPHIAAERRSHMLDRRIAEIAARQHGVISRPQLLGIGLTRHEIAARIRAGRLHTLHRGVYAVGHRSVSREGRYLAAVLASGEGAVLSHRAAADLWELRASKERDIDVTVMSDHRGDSKVCIHRDALDRSETMTRKGIRVTKPLRTLLDLASVVDERELERAIRQAVYRRMTTTALLAEAVRERSGQRGTKKMRKALINLGEAPGPTRSDLEEDFLRFLRKHRLPMPELNVKMRIRGKTMEPDCVWREQRLIVELDGRDAHDSTPGFESDRARDAALQAAGWRVVRVTSRRMRRDGRALARELRAILATDADRRVSLGTTLAMDADRPAS
jgi:very-short-patch-repair endonuclease